MDLPSLCQTSANEVCAHLMDTLNNPDSLLSDLNEMIALRLENENMKTRFHRLEKPSIDLEHEEVETVSSKGNKRKKKRKHSSSFSSSSSSSDNADDVDDDANRNTIVDGDKEVGSRKKSRRRDHFPRHYDKRQPHGIYTWNQIFAAATAVKESERILQEQYLKHLATAVATNRSVAEINEVALQKHPDPYFPMSIDTLLSSAPVLMYTRGRARAKTYIEKELSRWKHRHKETKEGIQFTVRINAWIEDMIMAYSASRVKGFKGPQTALMESFLFVEHRLHFKQAQQSFAARPGMVLRSYPLDLPYIFARFGSMLASLVFTVEKKKPRAK